VTAGLFSALPAPLREHLVELMTPVSYEPGEVLFRQGDPGDHLVVVETGRLEALLEVPGGPPLPLSFLLPGDVAGELSLLGDGRRTATVRAVEPTTGRVLQRSAFDHLRQDLRPAWIAGAGAIGRRAVERLDHLYRPTAAELSGEPSHGVAPVDDRPPAVVAPPGAAYLLTLLFFRHVTEPELEAIAVGGRCLDLPRGHIVEAPGERAGALWIVLRGAVETTLRGATEARRLRLAGPGRAVGHIGLLGASASVARRESRTRERAIVLELPWSRVDRLLEGRDAASRRFAAALWTDAVRALEQGERPMARLRAHGVAPANARAA
jgi:CRP-like cAMP-binding protein